MQFSLTQRTPKQAVPVVHFEIGCRNKESTKQFYEDAFSWSINEHGPATLVSAAESGITGTITALGHEPHNYVMVYIRVPDIEAYLERIQELGGKTVVGPVPIPMGKFAWFSDPEGNMLGLLEPKKA